MESIVELPDREANLFIKLCLQNGGRLSPAKRKRHFPLLSNREVSAIEKSVCSHMARFPRGQEHEQGGGDNGSCRERPSRHDF